MNLQEQYERQFNGFCSHCGARQPKRGEKHEKISCQN
jgi:hypothetical protein